MLRKISIAMMASPLLAAMWPVFSTAAEWSVAPAVQLRTQYDDNIYLRRGDHSSVWGLTISPRVSFARRTANSSVAVNGRLIINRYSNNEAHDRAIGLFGFRGKTFDQRNSWGLRADLRRDTTFTQTNNGVIDNSLDTDIGLVEKEVNRRRIDLRPSWRHVLSERSALQTAYRFSDLSYANNGGNTLVDYHRQVVEPGISHRITERDTLAIIASGAFYRSDLLDSNDYGLRVNWRHQFSETLRGNLAIGGRTTTTESTSEKDDSNGLVVNAGLVQQYSELTTYRLTVRRGVQPNGGGRVVQSSQLRAYLLQKLSPRIAWYLSGSAFRNENLNQRSNNTDRTYVSLEPGLRWALGRRLSLDASYRYRWQKYRGSQSAESNAVFLALGYGWPRMAASR